MTFLCFPAKYLTVHHDTVDHVEDKHYCRKKDIYTVK